MVSGYCSGHGNGSDDSDTVGGIGGIHDRQRSVTFDDGSVCNGFSPAGINMRYPRLAAGQNTGKTGQHLVSEFKLSAIHNIYDCLWTDICGSVDICGNVGCNSVCMCLRLAASERPGRTWQMADGSGFGNWNIIDAGVVVYRRSVDKSKILLIQVFQL